jgi:hypothetical protein
VHLPYFFSKRTSAKAHRQSKPVVSPDDGPPFYIPFSRPGSTSSGGSITRQHLLRAHPCACRWYERCSAFVPQISSSAAPKLAHKSGNESCVRANSENHRSDHNGMAFAVRVSRLGPRSHGSSPLPPSDNGSANCPSRPGFHQPQGTREDFIVRAKDRILLDGWKIRPSHPNGDGVLLLHGRSRNRSVMLPGRRIQRGDDGHSGAREWRWFAVYVQTNRDFR